MENARFRVSGSPIVAFAMVSVLLIGLCGVCSEDVQENKPSSDSEMRIDFPAADADLPDDRFALFIGIDDYRDNAIPDLRGCVNDAVNLQRIFSERLGFKRFAFLANEEATRDNIASAMRSLVEQIRAARTHHGRSISVVITYSGHGARVRNQNQEDDPEVNNEDSAWVTHDGVAATGERFIRDDDHYRVWRALTGLGAQVLLIADCCHSGTANRGLQGIPRAFDPGYALSGPSEELFVELAARGGSSDEKSYPGFIYYAACRDEQYAYEDVDDEGKSCGRFTYALRNVLPAQESKTTYSELHRHVLAFFRETWPYATQTPQFSASTGEVQAFFLSGGRSQLYAEILPGSLDGKKLRVSMGSIDGVTENASFDFFDSVEKIEAGADYIARGSATRVYLTTADVELEKPAKLSETAVACLDRFRMADFVVRIGAKLPNEIIATLEKMASAEQLRLTQNPSEKYSVSVYPVPGQAGTYGIYRKTAEPLPGTSPKPLRKVVSASAAEAAKLLGENLLYVARIQRIMSLSYNTGRLDTEICTYIRKREDGPLVPVRREVVEGVPRLIHDDRFTIRLQNRLGKSLYITVFCIDKRGNLEILFPVGDDPFNFSLKPRHSIEIGRMGGLDNAFIVHAEDEEQLRERGFERTQFKIVASSVPLNLAALAFPPETGVRGRDLVKSVRGSGHPLFDLIADALHGGPSARAVTREPIKDTWAAKSVWVDCVPK